MLIAVAIICGLVILILLFYPRRDDPYVRRVTKSYNGQQHGKERELY